METKKEKRIRFFFICFFICLTLVGFLYKYKDSSVASPKDHYRSLAIVLHKSISKEDKPKVALYTYKEKQHILALYEIDSKNHFQFQTLQAITLKDGIKNLAYDKSGNGFWLKNKDDWFFVNENLEIVKNNIKNKVEYKKIPFNVQKLEKQTIINITEQKKISIKDDKQPKEIFSLTEDDSAWLILYTDDLKIATIETK